jgi:hypothetical protein
VRDAKAASRIDFLLAVWRRLQSARTVALLVRDADTGAPQAQGTGSVAVETAGGSQMVMRERGRWAAPRGAGAHFTDALRWTLDTDIFALRLEHVRRGLDQPVPLVELVDDGRGFLTPLAPYLCGEDRYDASVRVVDGVVEVAWRVTGPRKKQEILRRYR